MPKFSITFILALPRQQEKQKPKKKEKQGKKGKNKEKEQENEQAEETVPVSYEVGKPYGFFHIEYSILPNNIPFAVDVICWEQAAKVYVGDLSVAVKTINKDEITWIVFTVFHRLFLTESDILNFHTSTITFTVWTSRNKQGARAKADKSKIFHRNPAKVEKLPEETVTFEELYDTPPDTEVKDSTNKDTVRQVVSLSALPVKEHVMRARETIASFNIEDELIIRLLPPTAVEVEVKEDKNKKKDKKKPQSTKQKKKTSEITYQLTVKGEEFFVDYKIIRAEVKPVLPTLTYTQVVASVQRLMSLEQLKHFNPLTIQILAVSHLPDELLLQNGITHIFFRYSYINYDNVETYMYPVQQKILVDDSRPLFTNRLTNMGLLQTLQTDFLKIEMHGVVKESEDKVKPSVFGQEIMDPDMSNKLRSTSYDVQCLSLLQDNKTVKLAEAVYDISRLIKGPNFVEINHHLRVKRDYSFNYTNDPDYLSPFWNRIVTPLTNDVTFQDNIRLTMQAKIAYPLRDMNRLVFKTKNILGRIIMVLYDKMFAKDLLLKAFEINFLYLGPPSFSVDLVKTKGNIQEVYEALKRIKEREDKINEMDVTEPRYEQMAVHSATALQMVETPSEQDLMEQPDEPKQEEPEERKVAGCPYFKKKALTGFVIDSFDIIIMCVEGQANGPLQQMWAEAMNMPGDVGRIMFDTSLIFEKRMYEDFVVFGGFYVVCMRSPLETYWRRPKTFMDGTIPPLAWKGLLNINMLTKTRSLKTVAQYKLFPTISTLLMLDKEFGLPMYDRGNEVRSLEVVPEDEQHLETIKEEAHDSEVLFEDKEGSLNSSSLLDLSFL